MDLAQKYRKALKSRGHKCLTIDLHYENLTPIEKL